MEKRLIFLLFVIFMLSLSSCRILQEKEDIILIEKQVYNDDVGVYSFLKYQNTTTINTANEFQQLNGLFNNTILEYFYYCEENNSIVYNNSHNRYLVLHWATNIKVNRNSVEIKIGISKNNNIYNCSFQPKFIKFGDEYDSLNGFCVGYFKPGDEIKLVVTTNNAGDVVTLDGFYIYINSFFNN